MDKPIELTDKELEAAAEAAYAAHEMAVRGDGKYAPWANQDWSQPKWRGSIDAAVAAINHVRGGDPVGTIRRDPEHGHIAVRCKDTYEDGPHWVEVTRSGNGGRVLTPSGGVVTDWPIIYQPGSDA